MTRLLCISGLSVALAMAAVATTPPLASAELNDKAPSEILSLALAQYAQALKESDRDRRLSIFAQAEYGFEAVIESGAENAALYTNLGHAALQAEHQGRAVLAYLRALRLDPDASTAEQNLTHARSLLPGWVPRPVGAERLEALFLYRRVSAATRSQMAAGAFALAMVSFAISVRRREGAWRGVAMIAGLSWLMLSASVLFDSGAFAKDTAAVVTGHEALARSADSRLAALAFPDPLPPGTELELLEEREDWTRVRLHNGRDVWLRGSTVTRVANPSASDLVGDEIRR